MQAPESRNIRRDPMAPDTEPTDEELDVVIQAAAKMVNERKRQSDAWLRRQIEEATRTAIRNLDAPVHPAR